MSRHYVPLQFDRPLFVKLPFTSHAKKYDRGDEYPWDILGVDKDKVLTLYNKGYIHHNEAFEKDRKGTIGDGLNEATIDQLHILVDQINEKVEEKATSTTEYKKKKCRKSTLKDKQVGHIRRWRNLYGSME